MKNPLSTHDLVKTASAVALAYCTVQAGVATLRVGQATVAGIKEFRKARRSEKKDENQS